MGKIISFGIQKGGVGKTTTTGITAWLLAKDYKVLAVDFDSQGNLTAFLTQQNIYDFSGKTVLQACQEQDPRSYIHPITENLHMLPAEDFLSTLGRWLFTEYKGKIPKLHILKETLAKVKDDYDFILIDLPPNVGEQTLNALTASDYAVILLQTEPWCYDALERYMELLYHVKEKENPDLVLAGVLPSMRDNRANTDAAILDQAQEEYGTDNFFNTVILRRSKLKDFAITGITDSRKDDREALGLYREFVKELLQRVQ